jgi:hypothetical protein
MVGSGVEEDELEKSGLLKEGVFLGGSSSMRRNVMSWRRMGWWKWGSGTGSWK